MASNLSEILGTIERERGGVATIHSAFSNFPAGIEAQYGFYKAIMLAENLPLPRGEREFLAVCTSKSNQCPYCISHHEEALKNDLVEIPPMRAEILEELANKLTQEPWKAAGLQQPFLQAGFTQAQWQHAIMVVSYFNFANRCAHGMGLELESDFSKTCK